MWDWVRHTRVAARYIASEQPLCCAMHPSGFMAALGTVEGLRLYYIMRVSRQPAKASYTTWAASSVQHLSSN